MKCSMPQSGRSIFFIDFSLLYCYLYLKKKILSSSLSIVNVSQINRLSCQMFVRCLEFQLQAVDFVRDGKKFRPR